MLPINLTIVSNKESIETVEKNTMPHKPQLRAGFKNKLTNNTTKTKHMVFGNAAT